MLQSWAAVLGFHIVGAVLGEVRFRFSCHDKTGFMAMFVCLCAIAFCFALFLNDVSGFILRRSTCVRFAQEPVSRSLSTCILYIFTSILSRAACQHHLVDVMCRQQPVLHSSSAIHFVCIYCHPATRRLSGSFRHLLLPSSLWRLPRPNPNPNVLNNPN